VSDVVGLVGRAVRTEVITVHGGAQGPSKCGEVTMMDSGFGMIDLLGYQREKLKADLSVMIMILVALHLET